MKTVDTIHDMIKTLEDSYLMLQVLVQEDLHKGSASLAVRTDSLRASLRNVICTACDVDSQNYQETIEGHAKVLAFNADELSKTTIKS